MKKQYSPLFIIVVAVAIVIGSMFVYNEYIEPALNDTPSSEVSSSIGA